jgi:hypothetical protein
MGLSGLVYRTGRGNLLRSAEALALPLISINSAPSFPLWQCSAAFTCGHPFSIIWHVPPKRVLQCSADLPPIRFERSKANDWLVSIIASWYTNQI